MSSLPKFISFGRLQELRLRPDADLIACVAGSGPFDDYKLRRFNSREALRHFCKDGSRMFALVKDRMPSSNFVTNRNLQTA